MINHKALMRSSAFLLSVAILSGCSSQMSPGSSSPESTTAGQTAAEEATAELTPAQQSAIRGHEFQYTVTPEDFSISLHAEDETIPAAASGPVRKVAQFEEKGRKTTWRYPDEQVSVSIEPVEDYLSVTITSEMAEDNSFIWPTIAAAGYYFPFGEGKRVSADEPVWKEYLNGQEFSVLEQLSMPFWASISGDYSVVFVMENPYRTDLEFSAASDITFSAKHEYPEIDKEKTNSFRIYLTDNNPVSIAKLYKNYVVEKGDFVTLEQKAEQNPEIRKLYGAPFVYLWGDNVISPSDIIWPQFRASLDNSMMQYLVFKADSIDNGQEFKNTLAEIRTQDYVSEYQKNVVCSYISQLLKREDFFQPDIFPKRSAQMDQHLAEGYETLTPSEKLQVNKYALAANWPEVCRDAESWMEKDTTGLMADMKEAGIGQAWIGLNSWDQAYAKPELVQQAVSQGYLIGSYDSYHSIHEPGKEKWSTAKFEDTSLYEAATVTKKSGEKASGFQNVGRKLNPTLSMTAVENRMKQIAENHLPFNSWFIDCDATGEILDDYTPGHVTTQQEDLAARLKRMAYIRDTYKMVVGSEGGHDFAASTIAYAHGIELRTFSWMDEDMKNKDSEYYIGKYYNPTGGVAEHFAKRIPIKSNYYTLFVDPQYDVPLFKLVYNDSVITGYHWDWSTFKMKGATKERMLREVLYNVPPLYHLDAAEWEKYKEDIAKHTAVWSEFSKEAILHDMTDFAYVEQDGSVQRTGYGEDICVVANFKSETYRYLDQEIPGMSVLIDVNGTAFIYTPDVAEENS